ncbi:MAG: hypothetical protein OEY33_01135 [Bdellovibrionales bacterium]|nr:hypothetical protein [Bdellovibrionales bacterium]
MVSRHFLVLFFLTILIISKFGLASEIGDPSLDPSQLEQRSLISAEEAVQRSKEERNKIEGLSRSTASEMKLDDLELQKLLDEFEIEKD